MWKNEEERANEELLNQIRDFVESMRNHGQNMASQVQVLQTKIQELEEAADTLEATVAEAVAKKTKGGKVVDLASVWEKWFKNNGLTDF